MDILSRYRVNHNSSSSEDDSDDSNDECAVWKRAVNKKTTEIEHLQNDVMNEELPDEKEEVKQPQPLPDQPNPAQKRKRNTIWCDVLEDQLMAEDLEDCFLHKPRNYGSRGKESYDYTRAYNDEKKNRDSESEMSGCSLNDDSGADSNFKQKKKRYVPYKKSNKFVKLDFTELDAARKINRVLNEKKQYLIQRIVKYVGIEKAMHLLELTKEVEENGGLMIRSQKRRRTPGGVYIQMLKDDKEIEQKVLDKIFEGELSGLEIKKHYEEKRKNKKKKNSKKNPKGTSKEVVEAEPMEPGSMPMSSSYVPMEPSYIPSEPSYIPSEPSFIPMDAEILADKKTEVLNSDISVPSASIFNTKSSENISDLEEGEIED